MKLRLFIKFKLDTVKCITKQRLLIIHWIKYINFTI